MRSPRGTLPPMVLRLKHLGRLASDVFAYSTTTSGLGWLLPLMVVAAVLALVVIASQTAVPYTVYTLF